MISTRLSVDSILFCFFILCSLFLSSFGLALYGPDFVLYIVGFLSDLSFFCDTQYSLFFSLDILPDMVDPWSNVSDLLYLYIYIHIYKLTYSHSYVLCPPASTPDVHISSNQHITRSPHMRKTIPTSTLPLRNSLQSTATFKDYLQDRSLSQSFTLILITPSTFHSDTSTTTANQPLFTPRRASPKSRRENHPTNIKKLNQSAPITTSQKKKKKAIAIPSNTYTPTEQQYPAIYNT